jgi:hypothetical protein
MAGCIDDREFGMNKNWLGTGSGLEIKVMLMPALFYLQSRPKVCSSIAIKWLGQLHVF